MPVTATNYYVDQRMARRCYQQRGLNPDDVPRDIANGTISVGPPMLAPGEQLTVIEDGAQYAIMTE